MPSVVLVIFLLGGFALLVGVVTIRRIIRHRRIRKPVDPDAHILQCPCGYSLKGIDTLRCPECGRIHGFDATPEQLGLTDDQLRQAKQKREQRRVDFKAHARS